MGAPDVAVVRPNVVLVSMPWTTLTEPSLGLGILKAMLTRAGIPCQVRHLNIFLLRYLKPTTYFSLANVFALNDFLFTGVLDETITSRQRALLRGKAEELLQMSVLDEQAVGGVDGIVQTLLDLRQKAIPAWMAECADEIARAAPTMVGFTCMFDQTIASVALARLVKQRLPETLIALGGYAVRQPTATTVLGAFEWVDAVCLGEGEPVIEALALASTGELGLDEVPGIVHRAAAGRPRMTAGPPLIDLDTVATPDYTDYYRDLAELSKTEEVDITVGKLPVENSRGCWWGAVRHCVFCGINDDDLLFRTKSPAAALATMDELHRRHGVSEFRFSDYILPRTYFHSLLPELVRRGAPYDLTAEMKANVAPRAFAQLAAAGFTEVQPGIESFSTRALKHMDKGTSKLHNIQTLLLGVLHGVTVHYNLLYGFPDDDADDYERLIETLTRLTHLDPPSTRLEVQITRYAPLQADPARFGIPEAMYEPSYQLIFSSRYLAESGFDLASYCYYFQRPFENSPALRRKYRRIDAIVDQWRATRAEREVQLCWRSTASGIEVYDSRHTENGITYLLDADAASVLLACSTIQSVGNLHRQLNDRMDRAALDRVLERLDQQRLVVRDGERALSIVVPEDPHQWLPAAEEEEDMSEEEINGSHLRAFQQLKLRRASDVTAPRGAIAGPVEIDTGVGPGIRQQSV